MKRIRLGQVLAGLLVCFPCLSSCKLGPPLPAPFTESSLNKNLGKPHRLTITGRSIDQTVDELIDLAKQRELTLVKQSDCKQGRPCSLVFRGKPRDRRILRGTTSSTLGYYSRYFFELTGGGEDQVTLSAVGVPVLGGDIACPDLLRRKKHCDKVPRITRPRGQTIVEAVRKEWGWDVSGSSEAEMLEGLIAELRAHARAPGPRSALSRLSGSSATAGRRTVVVAVFDIEDQSGSVKPSTLRQLTEYLATRVTQIGGYQVIPRDQLRTRISTEKRKTYRKCYDQRCQIELGKAVAAEKSLATKLLRVGKHCALTSMLYDLKSETTERAASAKTACDEDALLAGIDRLAKQL